MHTSVQITQRRHSTSISKFAVKSKSIGQINKLKSLTNEWVSSQTLMMISHQHILDTRGASSWIEKKIYSRNTSSRFIKFRF